MGRQRTKIFQGGEIKKKKKRFASKNCHQKPERGSELGVLAVQKSPLESVTHPSV